LDGYISTTILVVLAVSMPHASKKNCFVIYGLSNLSRSKTTPFVDHFGVPKLFVILAGSMLAYSTLKAVFSCSSLLNQSTASYGCRWLRAVDTYEI
jgi:hypothetical protein